MVRACRLFTAGSMDAETAAIKMILERHGFSYSVHDVRATPRSCAHSIALGSPLTSPRLARARSDDESV